jgi:NADH-quinone oxidoreductase subunit N
MGKLYLFAAAVNAGYVWLAVVGVLMSAVSLYYYFRIVLQMYLRDGDGVEPAPLTAAPWTERVISACAVLVLAIGLYPMPFAQAARAAMIALGGE